MPSHAHPNLHHRNQDRPHRSSPLPGGFFRTLRSRTKGQAERRLAAAVLEDAVHAFQRNRGAGDFHRRHLYWEVEQWFASRNSTPVFSFESVCATLGVSADEIRKLLMLWARRRPGAPVPWFLELPTRHRAANPRLRVISVGSKRSQVESCRLGSKAPGDRVEIPATRDSWPSLRNSSLL